jgi:hypothetical protein
MRYLLRACALTAVVLAGGGHTVRADGVPPAGDEADGKYIAWIPDFAELFERAKKEKKPVMIAVNAERVDGGKREPAGKELRERTYLDPTVVAKSRKFVCALLKPEGASADYAEVRKRFGIDGEIVSPQHIFAFSDGTLWQRFEYWPYGVGKAAVDKLLEMMDQALAAETVHLSGAVPPPPAGTPPAAGGAPVAPGSAEAQRLEWIRTTLEHVRKGSSAAAQRDEAIRQLVSQDQKGDCIEPLCMTIPDLRKDPPSVVAILRALGKPGLVIAAPAVQGVIAAQDASVRANAAVTLEYIGDPRSVEVLTKRLTQEKDEVVWFDIVRALGRCGHKVEAARKALLHEVAGARNADAAVAACIGLGYFERDAELPRELEKLAKKEGDYVKRAALLWALSEVGDAKSGDFVRKELLPSVKEQRVIPFYNAIIAKCQGTAGSDTQGVIDVGMGIVLASSKVLADPARKGRDQSEFKPKGEFEPRRFGGGGGGGGGGGMGG